MFQQRFSAQITHNPLYTAMKQRNAFVLIKQDATFRLNPCNKLNLLNYIYILYTFIKQKTLKNSILPILEYITEYLFQMLIIRFLQIFIKNMNIDITFNYVFCFSRKSLTFAAAKIITNKAAYNQ